MRYLDLDVQVGPRADGRYTLRANTTGYGQTAEDAELALDGLAPSLSAIVEDRTDRALLSAFGSQLHSLLFQAGKGSLDKILNQCLGGARTTGDGVRIRLRIEAPEIAALPWEFLYDAEGDCFRATSVETPVVRYLELLQPIRELRVTPPLAVLAVIPNADDIDAGTERDALIRTLDQLGGAVVHTVLDGRVTRERLRETLRERAWQVLHFIGHGDFEGDAAVLLLNQADGSEDRIDQHALRLILANHPSLKLVVLNSCLGAQVSAVKAFVGMAPQLVRAGVPAVVAMQYEIHDEEAVCFAREFYGCLFTGATRGRVEIAMAHARSALAADHAGTRALGVPVLFMRAPEGVLFEIATGGVRDVPIGPAQVETARAVERTREHNVQTLGLLGAGAAEPDYAGLLEQERAELARVRRLIRFRSLAGVGATLVAAVLFAAAWLGVFNWLPRWLRPEAYAIWLGDRFVTRSFDDRIVLVTADRVTEQSLGRTWDSTWRADHATLIDRLSRAGAAVIALDVVFTSPSSAELAANDAALADALQAARDRGTSIVLAVDQWGAGGKPWVLPSLSSRATLAVACLGRHLAHSATIVPLAIQRGSGEPLPSFALAPAMALRRERLVSLDAAEAVLRLRDARDEPVAVRFMEVERLAERQAGCKIMGPGDTVADLLIEYSDLGVLRDPAHRIPYERVVAREEPELSGVRGRIAVVGAALAPDAFRVVRGPLRHETRYGVELHADALNTILRGVVIRPAGTGIQFAATLLMALVGAAIAALPGADRRTRMILLPAAAALWMGLAVYVYAADRVTLIVLIQLAALVSAYGIARRTKRWVFP